jgi:hypothetical protein
MAGFPITIEVSGRLAVVVGLGAVGLRKARGLIEAGAIVRGIDPRPSAESSSIGVEVVAEPYREGHLEGALLAFAAASPEVNRLVVADCRRRGLLVNSASAPESGNFAVPAIHRSGPILLSVATSGAGPALAAMLRDRAAGAIGPAAAGPRRGGGGERPAGRRLRGAPGRAPADRPRSDRRRAGPPRPLPTLGRSGLARPLGRRGPRGRPQGPAGLDRARCGQGPESLIRAPRRSPVRQPDLSESRACPIMPTYPGGWGSVDVSGRLRPRRSILCHR